MTSFSEWLNKNFIPISQTEHAICSWASPKSLDFAHSIPYVPICFQELYPTAASLPLFFLNDPMGTLVVAPIKINQHHQDTVLSKDARWLGGYIPAFLRLYPFACAPSSELGNPAQILIDSQSKYFLSGPSENRIFDVTGHPTLKFENVVSAIKKYSDGVALMSQAASQLSKLNLLMSARTIPTFDDTTYDNMYVVNATALQAIKPSKMLSLCKNGTLALVYAHLTSLEQAHRLRSLGKSLASINAKLDEPTESENNFLNVLHRSLSSLDQGDNLAEGN